MDAAKSQPVVTEQPVRIPVGGVVLDGDLSQPTPGPRGLVLFVHGSGSSRHSPRNRFVARVLNEAGLATLLFDLLTPAEEQRDARTARLRFDIPLLAERLVSVTDWVRAEPGLARLPIGYFGASTGGGAALVAAAQRPECVRAVVSRGGRPDLADGALPMVQCATLLIVGGDDEPVIALNQQALAQLHAPAVLEIVPGATHLFPEPGALERVADLARDWFTRYLG